jgi:hypothetical protein
MMNNWTEERVGFSFGLLGGVIFFLAALVALALGMVDLVAGGTVGALNAWSEAVLLVVVGGLTLFFSYLGHTSWRTRSFSSGLLLVVVALVGAVVIGLGANLVALIGVIFTALAGILYLIEPTRRFASTAVAA